MEPQMQKFVEAVEKEITAEDIDTNIEGCIGCGNCGHACAWYLVENDPKYHPKTRADVVRNVYKAYIDPVGKVKASLGLIKKPNVKDLEDMKDAMWACTTCGRCTLACMQGVSNRRMIRIARTAYDAAGIQPQIVQKIKNDCIVHHHSFGSTREEVFGRVLPVLQKAGVQIAVDVVGAEYLWICSAIGNTKV
ncbi:MAG: (Fe-S)-binding protein, partial [Candidatus Altarchaeum sp. CG03_land_8_20_14_0_80_32_618]